MSQTLRFMIAAVYGLLLFSGKVGYAAEMPAVDLPIPTAIDRLLADSHERMRIVPARRADDRTLLRRTTLDLAGRIPTPQEIVVYEQDSASERQSRLVDRLLAATDYAWHLRNELDAMLLSGGNSPQEWKEYLLQTSRANQPWDETFKDLITPNQEDQSKRGASHFLKSRVNDLDDLTNDTSSLLFGVSINCAKCHDHPLVEDWKQDHYYGLQAFFARTYQTKSQRLAEKPPAELTFKTTAGVEKPSRLMFLTGATVEEPSDPRTDDQKKADLEEVRLQREKDDQAPPVEPAFNPRAELVRLALQPENRTFMARSIINRTWARLMGRGLVHPVDQMHSGNPSNHPELLDWLERDFIGHGFDVKRLIRGIVLSDAYARSSQWLYAEPQPSPDDFAVALVRPLTPNQLASSLLVGTSSPDRFQKAFDSGGWDELREQLEKQAAGTAKLFEYPGENFQVSVTEALLFNNAQRIENDYLRISQDRLAGYMQESLRPHDSGEQAGDGEIDAMIKTAFDVVFARHAQEDELQAFRHYFQDRGDRSPAAVQQMLWAMITSPEFRFNY
jgi:hypothetical protein